MTRRIRNHKQSGFGMFVVVLLVAVTSVVGLSLLDVIRVDLLMVGNEREERVAMEVAEGALMEVINDDLTPDTLPLLDDADLESTFTPASASAFSHSGRQEFTANAQLLRIVPLAESSHTYSRAVVHEVGVEARVGGGAASYQLNAEIYRTVTFRPGTVLPRRHAR